MIVSIIAATSADEVTRAIRDLKDQGATHFILDLLGKPKSLIQYITDRPGHDRRYALSVEKVRALGWTSRHTSVQALENTVRWYVDNEWWWRKIKSGDLYREYYQQHYTGREVDAPK